MAIHSTFAKPLSKLAPSGALIRLSSRNTEVDNSMERRDWQAGRSLAAEEQRCGMLTSVKNSLLAMPKTKQSARSTERSTSALVTSGNRWTGVVRCQASDWQVNELDSYGDVVTLNKRPKGQWSKVDKHQSILVEDNSDESFVDPAKTYTPRMANAGKYTPRLGKLPTATPVLNFNMYREHHSIPTVLERLRYATRLSSEALAFGGSEDYGGLAYNDNFGTVTQQGKALGMTKEYLPHASRHYGIHPLLFDPKHYEAAPALRDGDEGPLVYRTDSQGALYRVVVRCCDLTDGGNPMALTDIATELERQGFLNYYPIAAFSAGSNQYHDIAAAAGSGDYKQACSHFLQANAESNPILFDSYARYVAAEDSLSRTLIRSMADTVEQTRGHHNLVNFLRGLEGVTDYASNSAELQSLWEHWVFQKPKYAHAAIAFIWNAMASQRILSAGVQRVVVGDLIYVTEAEYAVLSEDKKKNYTAAHLEGVFAPSTQRFYVTRVQNDEQAKTTAVGRLVLPVCDQRNPSGLMFPTSYATREVHSLLAKQHGLDWMLDETKQPILHQMLRTSRVKPSPKHLPLYRTLIAYPSHVEIRSMNDPNSVAALKTDLFQLQERKPLSPSILSADRIRTPSTFNISPIFQETMEPIISHARAVSGNEASATAFIGARLPRNSHMNSFLREHFDIRHGRFHDLIMP